MRGRERTRARIRFPELTFVSSTALRGCAYLQSGVAFEAGRGNAHVDSEDHACTYQQEKERGREKKKERKGPRTTHTQRTKQTHTIHIHTRRHTQTCLTQGAVAIVTYNVLKISPCPPSSIGRKREYGACIKE